MRIRYVSIKSYRGLDDVAFTVGDTVTLIGRNDAGKTMILEAIRWFFHKAETGRPQHHYRWR